jgi:hypothetical protein
MHQHPVSLPSEGVGEEKTYKKNEIHYRTISRDGIGPEVLMKPLKFLMLLQKIQSRNHLTQL